MIEIISATRHSEEAFWSQSALGRSLTRMSGVGNWEAIIAYENSRGLSEIYNEALNAERDSEILILVHDDVWLDDIHLFSHVMSGLECYDILGVAGNKRRVVRQPAWAFVNEKFEWDARENLSGSVAHGAYPFGEISHFGSAPSECELLDGVFLAMKKSIMNLNKVRFDNLFKFHFYDMDFCRSAREKGLRLGTWPISITHQSGGGFGSPNWQETYRIYLDKWKG